VPSFLLAFLLFKLTRCIPPAILLWLYVCREETRLRSSSLSFLLRTSRFNGLETITVVCCVRALYVHRHHVRLRAVSPFTTVSLRRQVATSTLVSTWLSRSARMQPFAPSLHRDSERWLTSADVLTLKWSVHGDIHIWLLPWVMRVGGYIFAMFRYCVHYCSVIVWLL